MLLKLGPIRGQAAARLHGGKRAESQLWLVHRPLPLIVSWRQTTPAIRILSRSLSRAGNPPRNNPTASTFAQPYPPPSHHPNHRPRDPSRRILRLWGTPRNYRVFFENVAGVAQREAISSCNSHVLKILPVTPRRSRFCEFFTA